MRDPNAPPDEILGYYQDSETDFLQMSTFGARLKQMLESFSFLELWEIGRRILPNGPIDFKALDDKTISAWKALASKHPSLLCEELDVLCLQASPQKKSSAKYFTDKLSPGFWADFDRHGGEEAVSKSGRLTYRVVISLKQSGRGNYFICKMVAPVLGASRQLLRDLPTNRIIRVLLQEDLLYNLRDSLIYTDNPGPQLSKQQQYLRLREDFKRTFFEKRVCLLDGHYRPFYGKTGTRAMYLWSERSVFLDRYKEISVASLIERLIPVDLGKNPDLDAAKWSARAALLFSKTDPIPLPQAIAWVPDLSNHTLPISVREMDRLAKQLNLPFTPSCVEGSISGIQHVWSMQQHLPPTNEGPMKQLKPGQKLAIFEDSSTNASKSKKYKASVKVMFQFRSGLDQTVAYEEVEYISSEIVVVSRPPCTEAVMTDGNGLMSFAYARRIHDLVGLEGEAIATAYQARLGGCKGLWHLPTSYDAVKDDIEWLEIRDSQHKCDRLPERLAFGLIRRSAPSKSAVIGPQALPVLLQAPTDPQKREQMKKAIENLQEKDPQSVATFLDPSCDILTILGQLESISHSRDNNDVRTSAAREEQTKHWDENEKEDADILDKLNADGTHSLTGAPEQVEVEAIRMLQSGFTTEDPHLRRLLDNLKTKSTQHEEGEQCPVTRSRHAFVVADQTGLLKENEVFYQCSTPLVDPDSRERLQPVITGPVLLNRSPTTQATDWQRCEAVNVPQFSKYWDVVVCSTRGSRPFMEKLSGGDYDGDSVNIIWEPTLTAGWENADEQYITPPFEIHEFFEKNVPKLTAAGLEIKKVRDIQKASEGLTKKEKSTLYQEAVFAPFFLPGSFGKLSNLHREYLLSKGVYDPVTIVLGHLYTTALDAAKAGLRFKYGHLFDKDLLKTINDFIKVKGLLPEAAEPPAPLGITTAVQETVNNLFLSTKRAITGYTGSSGSVKTSTSSRFVESLTLANEALPGCPAANAASPFTDLVDPDVPYLWLSVCPEGTNVAEGPYHLLKVFIQKEITLFHETCSIPDESPPPSAHDGSSKTKKKPFKARARAIEEQKRIEEFWLKAATLFSGMQGDLSWPFSWRHLVTSCLFHTCAIKATSCKPYRWTCNRMPWLFCFKQINDIKSVAITRQSRSLNGQEDVTGPTMVIDPILKVMRCAVKRKAVATKTLAVDGTAGGEASPKRKIAAAENENDKENHPSKRSKDSDAWTPRKAQGRRMEVETSPLSDDVFFTPNKDSPFVHDGDDNFSDFYDSQPEYMEAYEEIVQLDRLRSSLKIQDSGIGSSLQVSPTGSTSYQGDEAKEEEDPEEECNSAKVKSVYAVQMLDAEE